MYEDEAEEESEMRDKKKLGLQAELKEIVKMMEDEDGKFWSEKMQRMFELEREIQELEAY
ncbi:hypothetical protein FOYG_09027 [Fusarium oxysporum NRRL 32931]|uniref:Uncharacterized protein n=1 Tax=Fusarium oxysporum NRRL 32931 TaxID=660029 RepID=W9IHY7_FUSOX|nr:hypothetical protein FOYG_09027 [Fusarium oxysporum NRRL 32931]